MKKHFLGVFIILFFIGVLVFRYVEHGIPAVFFSDLGNAIYPVFSHLGDKNLLLSYFRGWNDTMSFPFYWANANLSFLGPLTFFFIDDIWFRVKLVQATQIILAALFGYMLSWRLFSDKKIAILSSLGYATTPIFLSILNGHNSLVWSYVLLPLIVVLIEKTVAEKKIYLALFTGVLVSLATFISALQFIYYIGIPVFVYLIIRSGVQMVKDIKIGLYFIQLRNVLLVGAATLMFAGFFLVPTFFEFQPYTWSDKEILERKDDFVTDFYTPTFKEAASLQNKEQVVSTEFGYNTDEIPGQFIWFYVLISIFAFIGVILTLSKKKAFSYSFSVWAFVAAGLASFILSFGKHTFLYNLLDNFLPYFWTIRTPGRFLIFYALFVSIFAWALLWRVARWIFYKIKKQSTVKILESIAVIFFIAIIFYNSVFFGQILWTFKTTGSMAEHYPDLGIVQRKLAQFNTDDEYRVLDLTAEKDGNPHHLKAYSASHRTLAGVYDILWRFKDSKNFARILGLLNIKYIITAPWPSWPEALKTPFPQMEKRLEIDPSFEATYTSENGIKIWENKKALSRVYAAAPMVVAGSPLSLDSLLNIIPEDIKPAFFFADQITDEKILEDLVKKSSLVFINNDREEKPAYLNQTDIGWVFNDDFYLNPQNYGLNNQKIIELAKINNKPLIQYSRGGLPSKINLLSGNFNGVENLKIELVKNTANIVPEGKFGHRVQPARFDETAEMIYKITADESGKLIIDADLISLFRDNYVRILKSLDGSSYANVLKAKDDDNYPEFYDGKIWLDIEAKKALFLRVELLTNEKSSREVYDSRIEKLDVDFIKDSEYNYVNIKPQELTTTTRFPESSKQEKSAPGKFIYKLADPPVEYSAVVVTETYAPQWALSDGSQKIKSLPINIFTNGFLGMFNDDSRVVISYSFGGARLIGLTLSLIVIAAAIVSFQKKV